VVDVVTIFVPGNRMLMATGFRVEAGMSLRIRWLRGKVRFNSLKVEGNAVGPEGLPRDEFAARWPNDACYEDPIPTPEAGHAGLWALVDETPVFVGAERSILVRRDGEVKLGINDRTADKPPHLANTGGFWVELERRRPSV
jgi:hypothetical protein